jgi:putative peptide maturation dehydrogenase
MKVRRTRYAFLYLQDGVTLALSEGALRSGGTQVYALSLLTGAHHLLARDQLELLLAVPDEWVEGDERHARLLEQGLLVGEGGEPALAALRARDEALAGNEWNLFAAVYHQMTRWSGIDVRTDGEALELGADAEAAARAYVEQFGMPPEAFPPPRDAGDAIALPSATRSGGLYDALSRRRTTRGFDEAAPLDAGALATVLHYVFGCHGFSRNMADVVCIKRTSPSGGALHPVEAYPIVTNVDGIDPGIYHYDAGAHALEPIEAVPGARDLATSFMCGQSYFGGAQVSIVLTARFYRNHWKYRRHAKAYAGILMDAAHLSQTLQLVAADLGLGSYVTIAINARDIDERLGLDGIEEGAVAMVGFGARAAVPSPLELQFEAA